MFEDGLQIDLDSAEVTIDGFNSAFKDTPFEGKGFLITVTPLSHSEFDRLRKRFTNERKKRMDDSGFERALFMEQVKDWTNIIGPDKKAIPCTEETKEKIVSKLFFFARAVNLACLNARSEITESEQKNSKRSGDGK